MPGLTMNITLDDVDLRRVQKGLQLLSRAGYFLPPVLEELGEDVVRHTDDRWEKEVDPEGNAWAPLAPSTIKQKELEGKRTKILQRDGFLRHSIRHQLVAQDTLAVGTSMEYAAVQQLGGKSEYTIRAKNKKALAWPGAAHPVAAVVHPPLTPRPFLGISRADRISMGKVIAKHIRLALGEE